jgi:Na+/melibiose symporter-like transporter
MITALITAAAYALVGEGHYFGIGNVIPLVVGNSIAGLSAGAVLILPASMIADIIDQSVLRYLSV